MIYTSNMTVLGSISNISSLYANVLATPSASNVNIQGGLNVTGDVLSSGRMDLGKTIFGSFRLSSNIAFAGSNEISSHSNQFTMDFLTSDMSGMSNIPMSIPPYQVYNGNTGVITVPVSGFYYLSMQGRFENSQGAVTPHNGVYYKFLNHAHSNARIAASISDGNLVSTNHIQFLLAGDLVKPTFYSSDSNATLVNTNGETYVAFTVLMTVTPTHSNYFRVS